MRRVDVPIVALIRTGELGAAVEAWSSRSNRYSAPRPPPLRRMLFSFRDALADDADK